MLFVCLTHIESLTPIQTGHDPQGCGAGILQEHKNPASSLSRSSCHPGKSTSRENHYQLQDRPDTTTLRSSQAAVALKKKKGNHACGSRLQTGTRCRGRQPVCHSSVSICLFVSRSTLFFFLVLNTHLTVTRQFLFPPILLLLISLLPSLTPHPYFHSSSYSRAGDL